MVTRHGKGLWKIDRMIKHVTDKRNEKIKGNKNENKN